jgi:CheY-like chemotaxis protein
MPVSFSPSSSDSVRHSPIGSRDLLECPSYASADQPGILVVDDDPMILRLFDAALPVEGLRVWVANDGKTALEIYQEHQAEIHLVLLDIQMPGMDGPQILTHLREANSNLLACFMTGYAESHQIKDWVSVGVQECFIKPFRLQETVSSLRELAFQRARDSA